MNDRTAGVYSTSDRDGKETDVSLQIRHHSATMINAATGSPRLDGRMVPAPDFKPDPLSGLRGSGGSMRIGFGVRHPALVKVLDHLTPVHTFEDEWGGGALRLQVSTYVCDPSDVPEELTTSVRCVVESSERIVVCRAPNALHALPGGRREDGETLRETAVREVYEETGWHLDAEALRPLGFIHMAINGDPPPDYPYPHPDFAQVVFGGKARRRASTPDAEWVDAAGWEQGSFLAGKDTVLELELTQTSIPFIRAQLTGPEASQPKP